MNWNPETPYNQLPALPPELDQIETRRVLKACIGARTALAELKTASERLPDQGPVADAGSKRLFAHREHRDHERSALPVR